MDKIGFFQDRSGRRTPGRVGCGITSHELELKVCILSRRDGGVSFSRYTVILLYFRLLRLLPCLFAPPEQGQDSRRVAIRSEDAENVESLALGRGFQQIEDLG